MNSDQEESADQLDESIANSSSNNDQSFDQKGNGPREHAKPRRRRRGKKRKQRKESAATGETENPEECEIDLLGETHDESEYPGWDSDENLSCEDNTYGDVNVILRPINVPSAPLNSTQFIIDDHNDCQFYINFETPNPYKVSSSADDHYDGAYFEGDIVEPIGDDAAYIDIDYQYESPQDFDNSAYYDKDFELSYKSSRFEELLRSPRTELIGRLQALESRLKELTEDLMKENPSPILEKLQAELLELQEKNSYLKESNLKLSAAMQGDTSEPFSCQTISSGEPFSSALHDEVESEDSEKETYQECNESEEIVMSDLNTSHPNSLQDVSESYASPSRETGEGKVIDSAVEFHHHASKIKNHSVGHSQILVSSTEQCKVDKDSATTREEVNKILVHAELEKNPYSDINCRKVDLNINESRTESMSCSTTITNSECLQAKNIHPNSCKILHSQPNNHVKDDLRTLNLSTSELLHITNQTKCSSLVPQEGGMSPSETSVN